jgi:two-component system, chemotaxis family, chemotaxis protein CheY
VAQFNAEVKFLIADDQYEARQIIQSIIMSMGYINIHLASDGEEALSIALLHEVDFIICDWKMPKLEGIDVLKAVRKDPRLDNTKFLMLTAEAYKENIVEAKKAGVTDYLVKPITSQTLIDKVKQVIS